ncbi:LysM peptidoglycan-binding domain-containing protein [Paenibacillus soyae]|uniref:LysM peptidoglycan-binding domain-containing protein n=1 Tax=Paenibacillus soyae TaxID=2969249 RepID=A0A9X2MMP2_9BACL|nr:LysM peptidoglycan-binding domain-containing protein [Paenibacillus soyae]MCR2802892.1 LysM peptidoglycan-binding domain-containing protein [Paenibacillus soyae]
MIMMNEGTYRSIYANNDAARNHTSNNATARWLRSHAVKLTACILLALLLFSSFLLIRTNASGGELPGQGELQVTVGSGDSLWSIASRHAEAGEDVGFLVYRIKERNNLTHVTILPGQQLIIPNS